MTFLNNYENDIFISYAHIDNQPLAEGQTGWITSFHKALEIRLGQLLGAEPEFWRDESRLRGNDYYGESIIMHLPKVAVLVTVLSPRYIRSDWCLKEVEEFYQLAEKTGGLKVAEKSRVFKIVKTPVPLEQHPPPMQQLLGYEFYQVDPTTGKPREFIFNSGPNVDINYWSKLDDLAYDIFQLLHTLKSDAAPAAESVPSSSRGSVYLAETTHDLSVERDKIKRELQSRGYSVLPDRLLPLEAESFEKVVRENLSKSRLSVHLVGANYGVIPEASERSVAFLQNELASERCRTSNFTRIIWMPPDLRVREPRQQQFIEYLCEDPVSQHGAEVLQTSLEDLKTIIQDKLAAPLELKLPEANYQDGAPYRIYLINDPQDEEAASLLSDYLFDQGFEVIPSVTDGDEAQARADHRESLLLCDAILIYYGAAGEPWLRAKLFDLRKLAGYGRTKPLLAKAIYLGTPHTPAKERFRTLEATVIRQDYEFAPAVLEPFLKQISPTKGSL
jgi:hypothetical protein